MSKDIPITFVSIEKRRADLGDTVLDRLKEEMNITQWETSSIDYWIYGSDKKIIEGNLLKKKIENL